MYQVAIKNNSTGEIRLCSQDLDWDESSFFWWTQGNMGCDCNRELEFYRARGVELEEVWCGEGRYSVCFVLVDGKKILLEDNRKS
jgi:hypothetical protein